MVRVTAVMVPGLVRGILRGVVAVIGAAILLGLVAPTAVSAGAPVRDEGRVQVQDDVAERRLVEAYAPVLRLQRQDEPCGPGEPYDPLNVDVVLGNAEVALRGPWDRVNLVGVGPTGDTLGAGLAGYHLDFPGNPLDAGCTYEEWQRRAAAGSSPTAYARVVRQDDRPDRLALQYWFFYVFNDFNNKHEGDWEMIQIVFGTNDPRRALTDGPREVGYSQHEGAERAVWGADKLDIVGGTHPVVYVAAGSHANFFDPAVFLGRTGEQGVGCDDTTGPAQELSPAIAFVPSAPAQYVQTYPWLGYLGRWGEMQEAFFNGPTGPNMKDQWTHPITWAEQTWRDNAFAIPVGGQSLGAPAATDVFCTGVGAGSDVLRRTLDNPTLMLLLMAVLAALVVAAATRTRWGPTEPLPLVRRRSWGQALGTARAAYLRSPLLFVGIGSVYIPLMLLAAGAQWILFSFTGLGHFKDVAGERQGYVVLLVVLVGAVFALLAYVAVLAATAWSLGELDHGREPTLVSAVHGAGRRWRALAGGTALLTAAVSLLDVLLVTAPLGALLLVRRAFFVHAIVLEGDGVRAAFARSKRLVQGRWWHTALVSALVVGLGVMVGPLAGVTILFLTQTSFVLVNLVSGVVYAVTIPYVGLVLSYLYADLRERSMPGPSNLEPVDA